MNVQIEPSWKEVLREDFEQPYFRQLTDRVRRAYAEGQCFPPAPLIFNAFNLCPFDQVKVVIVGQDPYHNVGQAMGLAFSVPRGVMIPPSLDNIYKELADDLKVPFETIKNKVESLAESNPMLGHRGCRLGNTYPEITEMQARAIIEAALNTRKNKGIDVHVEIMVPLVGNVKELKYQKDVIKATAESVFAERNDRIDYMIGTMIEIPRAAVTANEIAEEAEFFSFGTNDLTQMTLGFSRDDVAKFLPVYIEKGILKHDPFQVLDQDGVGQLVREAVFKGRGVKPKLKCGICGEHGGEPSSVEFCHYAGLNYVSCSPFRVPIARLAAAHAALKQGDK